MIICPRVVGSIWIVGLLAAPMLLYLSHKHITEQYEDLPKEAAAIIFPQLDYAITALGGSSNAKTEPAIGTRDNVVMSETYYIHKRDMTMGTKNKGIYTVDAEKFAIVQKEYASINALLTDLLTHNPDAFAKIVSLTLLKT